MSMPKLPLSRTLRSLCGLSALLFIATLYAIVMAPTEAQMGISQKIFYFHVPSAYAMYVGFCLAAIGSGVFLWRASPGAERLATAGAEVGVLFCLIVLSSGPLWARKAWGVWWTWDPRLTTTLLAGMIFLAYLMLRASPNSYVGLAERKFAAGLAVLGLCVVPLIHYSVQRWRGQHPTVITRQGGGLDPQMWPPLLLAFLAFTALVSLLVILRLRTLTLADAVRELRRELEDAGYADV